MGSKSGESIRRREGWQDCDAAFYQNALTTCFNCYQPLFLDKLKCSFFSCRCFAVGLLLPSEQFVIENMKSSQNKYFVPFVWATTIVERARKEGKIKDEIAVQQVLNVSFGVTYLRFWFCCHFFDTMWVRQQERYLWRTGARRPCYSSPGRFPSRPPANPA